MKLRTKLAIAAVATLLGSNAWAQSANEDLNVSADVVESCTITTTAVAFGNYDPVGTHASSALTANGAVNIRCTKGASGVTLGLGNGGSHNGTTRRMSDGGTEFLAYELYHPTASTVGAACGALSQVWGTAGGALLTPTGVTWDATADQTFNVCGQVPAGQNAAAGAYTDIVVATVNF